jgi:hypothetical protein
MIPDFSTTLKRGTIEFCGFIESDRAGFGKPSEFAAILASQSPTTLGRGTITG